MVSQSVYIPHGKAKKKKEKQGNEKFSKPKQKTNNKWQT